MIKSHIELRNSAKAEAYIKPLEQNFLYIGSKRTDGIALQEAGALGEDGYLLIRPSGQELIGYTLINLSQATPDYQPYTQSSLDIPRKLGSNESVLLRDQDTVVFGSYKLTFYAGELNLWLDMPTTQLTHQGPLVGVANISYPSPRIGQPKLEIDGISKGSIEIDSGIQSSNPQKPSTIGFRLLHPKTPQPAAGPHRITFRVIVPGAMPNSFEQAEMSQVIQIGAYPEHRLIVQPKIRNTIIGDWGRKVAGFFR